MVNKELNNILINGINIIILDNDKEDIIDTGMLESNDESECKEEELTKFDIPEFKTDMCKQTMRVLGKKIVYHTPCIKTRISTYGIKLKYCYPSSKYITVEAQSALEKCLLAATSAAIVAVSTIPEPTFTIAYEAFITTFKVALEAFPEEIIKQLLDKVSLSGGIEKLSTSEWN